MTNTETTQPLRDIVTRVDHARGAVLVGPDGLVQDKHGLGQDDAEQVAATAHGMWSLARNTGHHFDGGEVRQILVEMDDVFLLVVSKGFTQIAVLADSEADVGMLAYEAASAAEQIHAGLQAPAVSQ